MNRKLQAVRLTLDDGQKHVFFGPAVLPEDREDLHIESIDFSNPFDYEESLSLKDLWLLMQKDNQVH